MSTDSNDTTINATVVFDNGSGMTKIGFAGDQQPFSVFPSVVGRIKATGIVSVGEEAKKNRELLTLPLKYPVERGVITAFDDIEKLWHHSFYNELKIKPEEYRVLLSEPAHNHKHNRAKTIQIMFETFNVPAMYLAVPEVLSLMASNRLTGIVIASGDGISRTVPIYEGYCIRNAVKNLHISGREINDYLLKILNKRESIDSSDLTYIKETFGYVALDYRKELVQAENNAIDIEKRYKLPDGSVISIGSERFRCCEILFDPSCFGQNAAGIHWLARDSINGCDKDIQNILYENIVLSGNSMLFDGMDVRIQKEMMEFTSGLVNVSYSCPYKEEQTQMLVDGFSRNKFHRKIYSDISTLITDYTDHINFSIPTKNMEWIGGSILASLDDFNEYFLSQDEYDSDGPYSIQRRCF